MSSNYVSNLAPEIAGRYAEKLKLFCDNINPYDLDIELCSTEVNDLPNITAHQIFSYLMLSKCPYSGKCNSNQNIEYENPEKSGTVTQMCVKKTEDISIVLGEVELQTQVEFPWFVCFPCGYVLCAHCTCSSGKNEMCIHIGAMLYKVNNLKLESGMVDPDYDRKLYESGNTTPFNDILIDLTDENEDNLNVRHEMEDVGGLGAGDDCGGGSKSGGQNKKIRKRKYVPRKTACSAENRPLNKLFVCGICSQQFATKEIFKEHCQTLHTLPANTIEVITSDSTIKTNYKTLNQSDNGNIFVYNNNNNNNLDLSHNQPITSPTKTVFSITSDGHTTYHEAIEENEDQIAINEDESENILIMPDINRDFIDYIDDKSEPDLIVIEDDDDD